MSNSKFFDDDISPAVFLSSSEVKHILQRSVKRFCLDHPDPEEFLRIHHGRDIDSAVQQILRDTFHGFVGRVNARFTSHGKAARKICVAYARVHLFRLTRSLPATKYHKLYAAWLHPERVGPA